MKDRIRYIYKVLCAVLALVSLCQCSEGLNPDAGDVIPPALEETVSPNGKDTWGIITDTDGRPIVDVVVSDGFVCVHTDKSGLFEFNRNGEADFVSYSIPSDYKVTIGETSLPCFYKSLNPDIYRYDFTLEKSKVETSFNLISIGDPQINDTSHPIRFNNEVGTSIYSYTKSLDVPSYAIALGDYVNNKWDLFKYMMRCVQKDKLGIPTFSTIGNHDHEFPKHNDRESRQRYQSFFGPVNYSFNRGDVHIVVMDNVIHDARESTSYIGGFEDYQLEWLKQDLSYVPKDKMIVFCVHIPFRGGASNGGSSVNFNRHYEDVINLLGQYSNAMILSSHTHSNMTWEHIASSGKKIYEHIVGTACGAWWRSTVCTDGAPIGFGAYLLDGNNVVNGGYIAAKHNPDFQIRLYRGSDIFTGGQSEHYTFIHNSKGQIIANVWNWDPSWKVSVYEDDRYTGTMSQYTDKDAWTVAYHCGVLHGSSTYNKNTNHLFYYTLKNPSAKVRVEATDRYGNKYSQGVYTDPKSNPSQFHADF